MVESAFEAVSKLPYKVVERQPIFVNLFANLSETLLGGFWVKCLNFILFFVFLV